jgi:hypothetical protein
MFHLTPILVVATFASEAFVIAPFQLVFERPLGCMPSDFKHKLPNQS